MKAEADAPAEEETAGEIFQKRNRNSFVKRVVALVLIFALLLSGGFLFVMNFTSYGYREQIFSRYGFTSEASMYLRKETSINILFPQETKPFGFQHSGYWSYNGTSNSVHLNSANDEVAVHEFAHAWYDKITRVDKNLSLKKNLVDDTIKLANLEDPEYFQTTQRARWVVEKFCFCADGNLDYSQVDDHHFYAYMAQFLMGKFKSGEHKLPEFMWPYFESMFKDQTKAAPCYESDSCDFPDDNNYKKTFGS